MRMRRHEQRYRQDQQLLHHAAASTDPYSTLSIQTPTYDRDYLSVYSPATPPYEKTMNFPSSVGFTPYHENLPTFVQHDAEYVAAHEHVRADLDLQHHADPCIDDLINAQYASTLESIAI